MDASNLSPDSICRERPSTCTESAPWGFRLSWEPTSCRRWAATSTDSVPPHHSTTLLTSLDANTRVLSQSPVVPPKPWSPDLIRVRPRCSGLLCAARESTSRGVSRRRWSHNTPRSNAGLFPLGHQLSSAAAPVDAPPPELPPCRCTSTSTVSRSRRRPPPCRGSAATSTSSVSSNLATRMSRLNFNRNRSAHPRRSELNSRRAPPKIRRTLVTYRVIRFRNAMIMSNERENHQ